MRLVVDTGVFSAALSRRRRPQLDAQVRHLAGNQLFLAAVTVAELRYACRRSGHPLADRAHANDLWIAASAIQVGAPLLTVDRVFDAVPELDIIG